MTKKSENVKKWRRSCKERIVAAMGDKCCICGYNKCFAALALHHLDPSQKDFSFGKIRANPKSWEKIVAEIRKCVLVCHNCHTEVHTGLAIVPDNAPRFNENFASYKELEKTIEENLDPCPVCGKFKPIQNKNCSLECAGKSKFKINWSSINLEEELKKKSVVQLAEELNCSDISIHKRIKRLEKISNGISIRNKKDSGDTISKNCAFCSLEIKVFASNISENNFCSKKCRNQFVHNNGWPSNEDLIKMKENLPVKEIAILINKNWSSVYERLSKIISK